MRQAYRLGCILALIPGAVGAQEVKGRLPASDESAYSRACKQGAKEADLEIEEGRITIYTSGASFSSEYLDRETGLPYKWFAGCEVAAYEDYGRASSHNARVRDHIEKHGLPDYSFKRWEKELFDLKGFFISRSKEDEPRRLRPGGPVLKSPEGNVTVRPIKRKFEKDDGSPGEMLAIIVCVNGVDRKPTTVSYDEGDSVFIWGPRGSDFAVIRRAGRPGGRGPWYMAFDLRTGAILRESR